MLLTLKTTKADFAEYIKTLNAKAWSDYKLYLKLRDEATELRIQNKVHDHPYFQNHPSCQNRRYMDRESQYFLKARLDYLGDNDVADAVFHLIFRKYSTYQAVKSHFDEFPGNIVKTHLEEVISFFKTVETPFTGAYLVPHRDKKYETKIEGWLSLFDLYDFEVIKNFKTARETFEFFKSIPGFGDFLAMQFTAELGWLDFTLYGGNEFVIPGNGAVRGLNKLGVPKKDHQNFLILLASFLELNVDKYLPFTAMDLQNTFCEFDKFTRYLGGYDNQGRQRMKRKRKVAAEPIKDFVVTNKLKSEKYYQFKSEATETHISKSKYQPGDIVKCISLNLELKIEAVTETEYLCKDLNTQENLVISTKEKFEKAAKKTKKIKPKYLPGDTVKCLNLGDLKAEIVEVDTTLDAVGNCVGAKYVCKNLETKELFEIDAQQKFRKFTPTLSQEEKDVIETREHRESYVKPEESTPLDNYIEPPNEINLQALKEATEVGFDIETYGNRIRAYKDRPTEALIPRCGKIRLMQVYIPSIDKCIIWDLGEIKSAKDFRELPGAELLIKKLCSRKCKKFIHNARFESAWIAEHFNIPILNVVDSLVLSQLYWAGLVKGFNAIGVQKPNNLEQVALRLFNILPDKTNQLFDYALPLGNSQYNYAAYDAKLTWQAGRKLLEMCEEDGLSRVVEAELAAIPAFAQMNYKGVPVCIDRFQELEKMYQNKVDELEQFWLKHFPGTNVASPKQVLECLKSKFPDINPVAYDKETKEMKPTSKNPAIMPYILENPGTLMAELMMCVLTRRSLDIVVKSLKRYQKYIQKVNGFSIISGNYSQNASQVTGRSSSQGAQLQNITTFTKKKAKMGLECIRSGFKAPYWQEDKEPKIDIEFGLFKLIFLLFNRKKKERLYKFLNTFNSEKLYNLLKLCSCLIYKFILVDLAASHAQIARFVSQDKNLIEANESGIKLHFYTIVGLLANKGIHVEARELAKAKKDSNHRYHQYVLDLYNPSKTIFYGSLNLQSPGTLQDTFLKKADMLVAIEICKEYIEGIRKAYPGLYACQKDLINKANSQREERTFKVNTVDGVKQVGIKTKVYGTARSIDGGRQFIEKFPNEWRKGKPLEAKGTDCVSYMWMRTEGTIMKKSLGLVNDYILNNHIPGWISQFCHDEIMCCVREDQAYKLANYMINTITKTFQELVPDYQAESLDPYDYIIDNWSEK